MLIEAIVYLLVVGLLLGLLYYVFTAVPILLPFAPVVRVVVVIVVLLPLAGVRSPLLLR